MSRQVLGTGRRMCDSGFVAQWIERLSPEQKVEGSNPFEPTGKPAFLILGSGLCWAIGAQRGCCLVCGRVRVAVAGGMPPWCGIGGFVARGSGLCAPVGWSGVVSGYGGIRPAVVAVGVTVLHDGMQGLCCGAAPAGTRGRGVARRARPSHAP